ncbi:MAG: FAD-dependent oxidoreductase, partial [Candidatus Electryoneaceae bacterium]|nr:FAD-dependent oxidoreductase [Candidatus Electryoneaceae bacterium]
RYFRDVKGVEVLTRHKAIKIDRAARMVHCEDLESVRETAFPYDRLVIATGSEPIPPTIPGVVRTGSSGDPSNATFFTTPDDAIKLRRELETGKIGRVAIIGAGFIGLELCEAFAAMWGVDVDLFELQPHVLSDVLDIESSRLVEDELSRQGINLHLGCRCQEIITEGNKVSVFDSSSEMVETDRIIFAGGMRPNTELATDAGLEIGVTGGIKVDKRLTTSDPDIFAAGDCVELQGASHVGLWLLGSLAVRMGRIAGDNICHGDSHFAPVAGSSILKVFDLTVGFGGMTEIQGREEGYDVGGSWGTFHDRMNYYPDSVPLHARLVYDLAKGTVLGFQAVSRGVLIHILDKATQIIRRGETLEELYELENAYAPPYAQPFDPLHFLAFIAENSRSAGVKLVSPAEYDRLSDDTLIIDVRSPHEIEGLSLDAGGRPKMEIPVEELRSRLDEIPAGIPVVTACMMGGRAWDAAIMLRRSGWNDVGILAGGVLFQPDPTLKKQEG